MVIKFSPDEEKFQMMSSLNFSGWLPQTIIDNSLLEAPLSIYNITNYLNN